MRYLLDTSALLTHYRQERGWEAIQGLFEDREADIIIASPSLAEFARRLRDLGAEDTEIYEVLDNYRLLVIGVVAIDAPVALAAYAVGRQTTDRLPLIDALIAAAAHVNEAILVHRDKHMAAIPGEVLQQLSLA